MPRANSSVPRHRRHRKLIKQAKGYYVPGAVHLSLRKMQYLRLGCMLIETEDSENVSFVVCGLLESMPPVD